MHEPEVNIMSLSVPTITTPATNLCSFLQYYYAYIVAIPCAVQGNKKYRKYNRNATTFEE